MKEKLLKFSNPRNKNWWLFTGALVIFVLAVVLFTMTEEKDADSLQEYVKNGSVEFSVSDTFLSEDTELALTADAVYSSSYDIYYTLDGSTPDLESPLYEKPLLLEAGDTVRAVPVKARVCYKNTLSDVVTKTYFVGKNADQRYTTLIASITTDPENLYDPVTGIMMEGPNTEYGFKNFDQRGDEWIRGANVEMFDETGNKIIDQKIGLGISGGYSANYFPKSLKLDANEIYDKENPKFEYPFFASEETVSLQSSGRKFNHLVLRNSGNDLYSTLIRWNLASSLAKEIGMAPVMSARPVTVYLNGEYYGLLQMQDSYSSYNLAQQLHVEKYEVEKFESSERECAEAAGYAEYLYSDLNVASNREHLEELVDMDNFLTYYAFQLMVNNFDWPQKNYAAYRTNKEGADNRIRFLLFDTDYMYNLYDTPDRAQELFGEMLVYPENDNNALSNVLKYPDYETRFVNIITSLMSNILDPEHLLELINRYSQEIAVEIEYMEKESPDAEIRNVAENWDSEVARLKHYAEVRNEEVADWLDTLFEVEDLYTVTMAPSEGADLIFGAVRLTPEDPEWNGYFFLSHPLTVTCETYPGYEFDHWEVNQQIVTSRDLVISPDLILEGDNQIRLVTRPISGEGPVISKVSAASVDDWIELYNPYTNTIQLRDFYLSDDRSDFLKYRCPDTELEPGETLVLYGKTSPVLNHYLVNFNLKKGEVLTLSDADGTILDQVRIPKMAADESYGRYLYGNTWKFFVELVQ
ncbi:CotH kinase family protein [Diplocloster modestus]|uniref:CotH kinase family protein n=1 Tax=Diplocloster modestus TaxID=2850322 RepID=A0ABS6K916_9FIRM|nr:CotH kinase family protein [Diplocloster modestus]MBU9727008.1 CotH kinase family protein [Diplocloster modestus]